MGKTTIKVKFTHEGLQQAIRELERYKANIEYKTKILAEKLAEHGVEVARVRLADLNAIFKSELISSIHSEYQGSKPSGAVYVIKAGTDHCAFVEFGTGYVGKAQPYKHKLPKGISWEYVSGKQILANADNGIYGWFYPADDGNWYFTEGMPSRPYMYETSLELQKLSAIVAIAREVFG